MTSAAGIAPLSLILMSAALAAWIDASAQVVRYELTPVPRETGIDLRIAMSFPGDSDGETTVFLPRDRFGVPAMHRFVRDVRVTEAGVSMRLDGDTGIQIAHPPRARVALEYTVRYDSARAGFAAFGPSVGAERFHFLGSQWLARVGPPDSVRRYVVRVAQGAVAGPLAGSFGLGPGEHEMTVSYDDLEWTVIAGGAYRADRFACETQPVMTLVSDGFELPDDSIFALARKIVCGERAAWNDYSQPFYAVIITARGRLRAGVSLRNAFACFLRPDARTDQLALLLAHETLHEWLPRRLRVVPGPDEPEPVMFSAFHDIRYDWFHEGFTEYLARSLLVQLGLASQEWFVERLNEDLARLGVHPYRTASVHELEQAVRAGRFTNFHQQLSYLRGTALAFNWDAAIRRESLGKRNLLDALRALLREAAGQDGRVPRARFEQVLEQFGIQAAVEVERFAIKGEPILIDSLGLGSTWTLHFRNVPAFTPGFDVVASTSADTVLGVQPAGPAHAAGLRDGMPIVRITNGWRWNDEWRADQPITVVVREEGRERAITFPAVQGETAIPYFLQRPPVDR